MNLSPCAQIVKNHHRSAYLYGLLAPQEVREHVFALYAFAYEIEHIRTTVSEEMVGLIRLQWWRDTIAALYEDKSRNHDVVQALEKTIHAVKLPQDKFEAFFTAHEQDLSPAPFGDMDGLKNYAKNTNGTLLHFILYAYGIKEEKAYECAEFIGYVQTICTLLSQLPYHIKEGWCTLPESLLQEQGTSSEALLAGEATPQQIAPVINALINLAEASLQQARVLKSSLSKESMAALRMASLLPSQIKKIKKAGADVLHSPIIPSPLMTPMRLWLNKW